MIKTLLKRQLLGALAVFTMGKDGKKRSKGMALGFSALILYSVVALAMVYWEIADMLCAPFVANGMTWAYFAFMGVMAAGLGLVLGIFTAKARLYEAKDNDLLLSLPIPSWVILFSRTVGMYLFTLAIESVVFIPAFLRYFTFVGFSILPFVCSLVVLLILPLISLALSYLLGWLMALISAKLPGKNVLETIFAILFMVVYFSLYTKINEYLGYVVANGEALGEVMKTVLYPFSQLGQACTGDLLSLLIYALIFAGGFGLVYFIMSATYLRLATVNKGSKKVKYKGKGYKGSSAVFTLTKKELRRFSKNTLVMLNCFMGSLLLMLLPVVVLLEKERCLQLAQATGDISLLFGAAICLLSTTNFLAPSCISLEGDSLDVVRVLPIKTEKIFLAKWLAGVLTAGGPALFACVCLCIGFQVKFIAAVSILLVSFSCIALWSAAGIAINLLLPNLQWTNEVAAVKQSASTLASMFGGMALIVVLVAGYFLIAKFVPAWGYLLICAAFMLLAFVGVCLFLKKKGVKIFEAL